MSEDRKEKTVQEKLQDVQQLSMAKLDAKARAKGEAFQQVKDSIAKTMAQNFKIAKREAKNG